MESAYEIDTLAWALDQARRIRGGEPFDTEHVAEEIEDLGKRQRAFLVHNLEVLLMHLLKRDYQPEKQTPSWLYSIKEHRIRVTDHLEENPSLAPDVLVLMAKAYRYARLRAARETGLSEDAFPEECPYNWEQVKES